MKKIFLTLAVSIIMFVVSTGAFATTIEYTASGAGPSYNLDFTVINDTLSDPIQWLSIYFGQTSDGLNFDQWDKFNNFSPDSTGVSAPTTGWWSYSFEPSAIDLPGQFNADALGNGINAGDSLSSFMVSFDMASGGIYDHLFFKVGNFDAQGGYNILDTGYTKLASQAVPEPGTIVLLGAGLVGLVIFMRKRNRQVV